MNHRSYFKSFFEAQAIAFIGSSTTPGKWGFNILHSIIRGGYAGKVYPINPQGGTWFGTPVYKKLAEAPRPIDMAFIVVPKEKVLDELRECIAADIHAVVIITAGFGETGAEGKALEQEVISVARAGGVRIVGPNTMGVYSAYPSPMQGIMAANVFKQGYVSVISQSGNLGTSIALRFIRRGIGISRLISSGNEADFTIEDYLEYLENDDKTRLICLYVEGVRHGRRFIDTVKRITAVKPIILLKGGTGAIGSGAAMSHTGAMAGNYAVFKSMCTQTNIMVVDSVDEMANIGGLMLTQPEIMGKRIGIVTQGGGWGVLSADLCEGAGLEVPPLHESVIDELDSFLPEFWSRRNPVDLVAPSRISMVTDSIEAMLKHKDLDAIILLGLGYMTGRALRWMESPVLPRDDMEKLGRKLIRAEMDLLDLIAQQVKHFNKPIIPVIDIMCFDETGEVNIVKHLDSKGIMAYSSPEQAICALTKAHDYYRKRRANAAP